MTHNNSRDYSDQDIDALLLKKQSLTERLNSKKGKRFYLFVKMPMKASSVENLVRSADELKSNIKAVNSVICPHCSNGILMCDRDVSRDYPGKVEWWCSRNCGFKVFAQPTFKAVKEAVKVPAYQLAQARLASMSVEERQNLISTHQYKSNLFRLAATGFFAVCIWQLVKAQWFLAIQWVIIAILAFLFAIKWGYRAWQIKSGNVHLKHAPFVAWLFNAPKWFSLNWYDEQEERRIRLQNLVNVNEEQAQQDEDKKNFLKAKKR